MTNRAYFASIAFRLPAAILLIGALVLGISAIAIFGLMRARNEMATYGTQAFVSLGKSAIVSKQVSDLVSSAPFLMNATSPYRISSESRAVLGQVEALMRMMKPRDDRIAAPADGRVLALLGAIQQQTVVMLDNAEAAQEHKSDAAIALSQIATRDVTTVRNLPPSLNAIAQSASTADSLFQLGELQRRYVRELSIAQAAPVRMDQAALDAHRRIFAAQTRYLREMFSIRAAITRLHTVSRELSLAVEAQNDSVVRKLGDDVQAISQMLQGLLSTVFLTALLMLIIAALAIRSVMRVSRGIADLSAGMNALAGGQKQIAVPSYRGNETELIRLVGAFSAFRESVDRVSRMRRKADTAAKTIRAIFRSMNEGIAVFDAAGKPLAMNRRVIELIGRGGTSRKLPLRRFLEDLPGVDRSGLQEAIGAMDRPGRPFVFRHRREDGQVVEVSLSRQLDGGFVLLARDVTETDRQDAEDAKAQRLDGIMRMTHQLAHEVGNMIGIVTGSLGLLEREDGITDRQRRHLNRIRKAADRGHALSSSMLSVASQQQLFPVSIDLAAVLMGMIDVLEIAVGEACRVTVSIDTDLPPVFLDPALFEQSVLNLCLNAAAAMPDGGEIAISATHSGAFVTVTVADEGMGMTPEAIDKAFEPYFTTRLKEGGAGLGLATVYGFVRQSGGDASIQSRLGHGTKVELTFVGHRLDPVQAG
ncbi:two-component sensor histidine kinase [Xaviernesmea oryzae]|uniref:histidine kinase n=1 Tax=Xaviernesmea oryzae TaxID=464029 RepID=A0A1Q9AW74_9HYPH|nr:ATP-binding protein [Xaviernesmea oryzae]OLP59686.1 two-component sensor histidine kinase [Xaviernesmea oryzae]SEM34838.1 Signal transduction histidine kinase [Xaviernesmea oryzae]